MADGRSFSRIRLAAISRTSSTLKPWKNGEFFAWDLSDGRKDHHHAHIYPPEVDAAQVKVEGHVVTAKGNGAERNQTKHTFTGTRNPDLSWAVGHAQGQVRLDVAGGSPEVPLASHAAEDQAISQQLTTAIDRLLNTEDQHLIGVGKVERRKQYKKRRKKEKKRAAARARNAAAEEVDPFEDGLGLFD